MPTGASALSRLFGQLAEAQAGLPPYNPNLHPHPHPHPNPNPIPNPNPSPNPNPNPNPNPKQAGLHVSECSVTQCTLEQIFLLMASKSSLRNNAASEEQLA